MASPKTVILVTGASSGIGLETVLVLAQESQSYEILAGSRSIEKGQKALDDLRSTPGDSLKGNISVVQIDIINDESISTVKEQVETKFGRLDVLINNAGIAVTRKCDTLTNLRETFDTNTFGPALVTETFEPLLKKSSNPLIIYVSSDQGSITHRLDPKHNWTKNQGDFYKMSKTALNMLAACHRANFAQWGCKVCAFNPGFCVTNLSGPEMRERRIKLGGRDPREPALALLKIVKGERDQEIEQFAEKSGMLDLDGGILPW
ncbi:putative short chain dehydrogenase/reductase [Xylariales sp. PMI_506]|nr:putative short chain dehydrogenase/reductase [Xylariales sp. PMI_506]